MSISGSTQSDHMFITNEYGEPVLHQSFDGCCVFFTVFSFDGVDRNKIVVSKPMFFISLILSYAVIPCCDSSVILRDGGKSRTMRDRA
jgi:hypothetical protein